MDGLPLKVWRSTTSFISACKCSPWRPAPLFTGAEAYHFLLLCQRQLYAGYPADAMKTAMRLREYEQVLPPAEIYSLIALTAFYSKYYAQCSKAFVRLQSMSNLPPHKKEAIDKKIIVDFKDQSTLKYFVTERGKIIPRRISGNCSKHQRAIAKAVKQSRGLALIPYLVLAS